MDEIRFSNAFSLTEEIANILRAKILKGEYGIRERMKESVISKELGVSRTPIREAFKQLETEGLIESIPNRGCFAIGFTKEDIQDIYAVRASVEILAMSRAIENITDKELKSLRDIYDLMEFYTKKKDAEKVLELNKTFHEIIYNATNSRFLVQTLKSYQSYVQQTRKASVYCVENLNTILQEHREILESVEKRDKEVAMQNIEKHLENSRMRAELGMNIK